MAVGAPDVVLERFVARCDRLGVRVRRVQADAEAIAETTAAVLRAAGARTAIVADDLGPMREMVLAVLSETGVSMLAGDTAVAADPAEVGISRAAFAVAETGSLGIVGDALQPRLATMLPPIHVALVDASSVYASLDEAGSHIERVMSTGEAHAVSFVTGPSRTADVEKTLALGVHGPREVHVLLIESRGPNS